MACEWRSVALADLTEPDSPITYGVVKPGPEDTSGVLFIRGGDIADGRVLTEQLRTITREVSDQYKRTLLQGGELVVSLVGNPGQVAIVPPELRGANIARQVGLIRLRPGVDTRFVKYALSSTTGQVALGAHSLGSVQQVINLRDLKTVRVLLPELKEQRAIAAVLGALDDKIELNRRMCRTLEGIARAIFQAWFVDFEPVRAKAAGAKRFRGMPQAVFDTLPTHFVDSPLGPIPKGWRVVPFDQTVEVFGGGTPNTAVPEYWGGAIPWFSVVDSPAEGAVWVVDTEKHITQIGLDNSSTRILPVGTTILTARGTVGKIALVGTPMAMNQSCYGLRGWSAPHGFFTYFMTKRIVNVLRQWSHGCVFDTITRGTLSRIAVVDPDSRLIHCFDNAVHPWLERIRLAILHNRTLAALRDALLPKLVSGELRIRDVERIIGRCA